MAFGLDSGADGDFGLDADLDIGKGLHSKSFSTQYWSLSLYKSSAKYFS